MMPPRWHVGPVDDPLDGKGGGHITVVSDVAEQKASIEAATISHVIAQAFYPINSNKANMPLLYSVRLFTCDAKAVGH
jgi:hypothetical protein